MICYRTDNLLPLSSTNLHTRNQTHETLCLYFAADSSIFDTLAHLRTADLTGFEDYETAWWDRELTPTVKIPKAVIFVHVGKLAQLGVAQLAFVEQSIAQTSGIHTCGMGSADENHAYFGESATRTPGDRGRSLNRQVKPVLQAPPGPHGWRAP